MELGTSYYGIRVIFLTLDLYRLETSMNLKNWLLLSFNLIEFKKNGKMGNKSPNI